MRPGPPCRTQSAFTGAQVTIPKETGSKNSPTSIHGRYPIFIPKDMHSPFQPFLGLQQADQTGFMNETGISWPIRFDESMTGSSGFVPNPQKQWQTL